MQMNQIEKIEWKPFKLITVSTNGDVLWKYSKKSFQIYTTPGGYKFVYLWNKLKFRREKYLVHQLVAFLFIRPVKPNEHVHHINGNVNDNRKMNLKIMSANDHRILHLQDKVK